MVTLYDEQPLFPILTRSFGVGAAASSLVLGIVLVTGGFFGTHSVASGWVPARATDARGQSSAVYLLFYYLGSSVCGTAGGVFWSRIGWPGVVAFIVVLAVGAFAALGRLSSLLSVAASAPRRDA